MMRILIADDDAGLRLALSSTVSQLFPEAELIEARHGGEAIKIANEREIDLALLDIDMPEKNGLEVLTRLKEKNPGTIVIMLTAYGTIALAVEATKRGAFHFLEKPVSQEALREVINRALSAHSMISQVAASHPLLMEGGRPFLGQHLQMQKVFSLIHRLSKVDTPVLIRGASGTGKELVARAIHFNSPRKDQKFVAINCSAIPENLFESELFGHEKGAFTGADQKKLGKIQYAEGGTLFLDEVGDLPLLMQVKLLRVLQEKVFTPVGSNKEIPMNVRIIAATNRPLEEMMQKGQFREDLYYRLNVIPIFLPSLVDRIDDLDILVPNFIKKFNEQHGRRMVGISVDALQVLKKYSWPGNIRELENVIEHAFVMETSNMITMRSLPETILAATQTVLPAWDYEETLFRQDEEKSQALPSESRVIDASRIFRHGDDSFASSAWEGDEEDDAEELGTGVSMSNSSGLDFNAEKEAFEREFIIKALKMFKGRINQTALHANIPKKTLLRKIEKYGINPRDFMEP
ncbi:MAG: sigma-54 dependent transcriptional regulator [Bdellovibrionaceae bacterium]|nr:sigma-54 dependent transcriptional regulator [Pseudobdellovibrionaceae bacterium]